MSSFPNRLPGSVILALSVIASAAFWLLRDSGLDRPLLLALKGAPVGLLALFAWIEGTGREGRMIAAVMALGACGDVLLEVAFRLGAASFLAGHLVAFALYFNHHRRWMSHSQRIAVLTLFVLVPVIAFRLPADRAMAPLVGLYGLGLGAMASSAWASSYSRYTVGLGAVLFVLSDLLIFAGMGPLAQSSLPHIAVWPVYYTGQLLVCLGVVRRLRADQPSG